MLFTKSLSEVTFEDVQAFCETWPEGVRVEYKRIETKTIPKIVSSLANTVGGIWIIGVKTDPVTNHIIPPIEGIPIDKGIEERITQSCYANLYPPLLPDIRILPVPNSNNIIVIVQVRESIEAPHAIENSTRVYIRTNATTERIELAEIDRIDYLLKRRRDGENRRHLMLDDLQMRSPFSSSFIRIKIGPQYPYQPILSRDDLTKRIKSLPDPNLRNFHVPIRDGYMAPAPSAGPLIRGKIYFAVNFHGMMVYSQPLTKFSDKDYQIVDLREILSACGSGIETARVLLEDRPSNLKLAVDLAEIGNCAVQYNRGTIHSRPTPNASLDSWSTAELQLSTEELIQPDKTLTMLVEIIWQLMWPFGWHSRNEIEEVVRNNIPN